MKTMKFYMGISLLAALLLFSGCGKELDELPAGDSGTESPENPEQTEGELLHLRVSDAGYLDAGTGSRATDSGLTTTFEDGDKIGLFVVNNENEVLYANVPYTKSGEEWTASQNVRTKGYPVRVFAYYPYVEDDKIIGKINNEAQDASAFFKTYIDGLDITDQSTPELYRQADVMACMVEIEDKDAARKKLTLTMNHLMGLLVIDFPEEVTLTKVKHYLKGDNSFSWLVEKETSCPFESEDEKLSIQALHEEKGYRYICKSNKAISFSGAFTTYGSGKSYSVSDATVSAGSCKTYRIFVNAFEPVSPALVEYAPQVGDFYMKDGSVLSSISEGDKNNCVGIVCWVPTEDDSLGKHNASWLETHPNCTHGLVVGLKHIQTQWGIVGEQTNIIDYRDKGFVGFENTQRLILERPTYPVVSTYRTLKVPLLTNRNSDWYIPSIDEMLTLHYNYTLVSQILVELGTSFADPLNQASGWSSGEQNAYNGYYFAFHNGYLSGMNKDSSIITLRLYLAF